MPDGSTSSFDSFDSSVMPGLLASRGAVTFDRPIVLSGGGPPLGGPLTITVSPDSTCTKSQFVSPVKAELPNGQ